MGHRLGYSGDGVDRIPHMRSRSSPRGGQRQSRKPPGGERTHSDKARGRPGRGVPAGDTALTGSTSSGRMQDIPSETCRVSGRPPGARWVLSEGWGRCCWEALDGSEEREEGRSPGGGPKGQRRGDRRGRPSWAASHSLGAVQNIHGSPPKGAEWGANMIWVLGRSPEF